MHTISAYEESFVQVGSAGIANTSIMKENAFEKNAPTDDQKFFSFPIVNILIRIYKVNGRRLANRTPVIGFGDQGNATIRISY